ncbi:hypothetical protein A2W54_00635 [Candidatus Giovannonibacteria bacterium RIFCSPHIGHO2_02_43_13]|uniref:type II site-specific deoxyribonuclease n=1 Tax=Candidatus Giovannonibacteria bacterium RIFCSPHIGHO2_02_43_13 TaxID=1798330 RepID=A0A1F5WS90_9BACT|nr:MAG: hypothetical protein UW28_C0018G0005 [Parcubacteria group bacterium GW2011_GWA2_44_13]OGF73242.1 MAG: hypothetical protein A3E06_01550 [Candidatus Giovannonibacteria bacterium RIFCSPHIGHO2_12_FULL_44_42]OGF78504.1 MAG: hypothetical protein A2W54_00635 [Candidatus Giovannonibacteria bacterium RIFCSPHIGHO2_02_43_13]OGF89853.1 MAG: hypothetical protein A3I94_02650 [Candidatus Giovannonibacteria bacterium RIFCSPLOWO2_02_FULL_43_54]OGF96695.1 MAG: hypothetical protein A3H08_02230 [Candidatus
MSFKGSTKNKIKNLLLSAVRDKLANYKPETSHMPFHYRLLGKDRFAIFSFIHSMNTTFGMSVWEQVAAILSQASGDKAQHQYDLEGTIDTKTEKLIRNTHYNLRKGIGVVNMEKEAEFIKNQIKIERAGHDPDSRVDLFISSKKEENYFDIISAKPNIKEFATLKLKLLRWIGLRYSQGNKQIKVYTRLAIPYNPYHPEPYDRWTLRGLYDLKNGEILVGEEFWNFVAKDNIYQELLDIFEEAGKELRKEIDRRFSLFK